MGEMLTVLGKLGGVVLKPVMAAMKWGRNVADAELAELRFQINEVLNDVNNAAAQAQIAVRGSSNDPETHLAHRKAIELSTTTCQRVASLFRIYDVGSMSPEIVAARLEFREAVTNEDNPAVMGRQERDNFCTIIEQSAASFCAEITDESFKRWGQGVGSKAGKLDGRKVPK